MSASSWPSRNLNLIIFFVLGSVYVKRFCPIPSGSCSNLLRGNVVRSKKSGSKHSNAITLRYRYQIQGVDNITDKTKIQMFIRNMPASDSHALRKYIDSIEPGIEMKNWMECPMCGEESEVRMPLGASFFWPDAG